ncbi:kinase-like domain-containing protein [Thelephora terrestris]|uniref:Kinase-like domain-containing protein n=1 Tax=Thelephora terrestris TaxID=56493 RepID=A0A9P6L6H2_9AGAM|nr:kinase-like domain-containing protein [Thelephora terrestris]
MVKHLRGDDAQTCVDVIDETSDMLPPWLQEKCLGALRKICGRLGLLPRSVRIQIQYDTSEVPRYRSGSADVWKGQYQDHHIAVKVLRVCTSDDFEKITRRFCKEAVAWKSLRHPNVLPLLGVMMRDRCFVMASKWMNNGNIKEFIRDNRDVNRFELVCCVTHGLMHMHSQAMVHGDLKGANILVDDNGRARIADFGLLTIVSDPAYATASSSIETAGTIPWMSPELFVPEDFGLEDSRPTKASDCYALGMVILEVLSDRAPYNQFGSVSTILMIIKGDRPERPERPWFTDDLWGTLEQCWSPQPTDRPTIESILECLGWLSKTWHRFPLV